MATSIQDIIDFFSEVIDGDYDFDNDIKSDIDFYVREGKKILDGIKNNPRKFLLEHYDEEDVDDVLN